MQAILLDQKVQMMIGNHCINLVKSSYLFNGLPLWVTPLEDESNIVSVYYKAPPFWEELVLVATVQHGFVVDIVMNLHIADKYVVVPLCRAVYEEVVAGSKLRS